MIMRTKKWWFLWQAIDTNSNGVEACNKYKRASEEDSFFLSLSVVDDQTNNHRFDYSWNGGPSTTIFCEFLDPSR